MKPVILCRRALAADFNSGANVGANAVVARDIAPNPVAAGVPACVNVLGLYFKQTKAHLLEFGHLREKGFALQEHCLGKK